MKKIIIALMVLCGFSIAIANVIVCGALIKNMSTINNAELYNTAIESGGLSIVSIAISVWVGISIYNAVEKNELKELKSTIEMYSPLSEHVREYTKKQLVNQMYKTGDISCDYMAKCFDKDDQIPIERYADLLTIDILLHRIYESRKNEDKEKRYIWAKTGIAKIKGYKDKFKKLYTLEKYYLNYREADFHFYMGGCCENEDKYREYKTAKNLFIKVMKEFNISVDLEQEIFDRKDEDEQKLSVYFANAIGQCMVNMMNERTRYIEEYERLKEEAHRYLKFAVNNSVYCGEREVYYRNYGCFIENHFHDYKSMEKAYELYKKALRVEQKEKKVYVVLISNLNKRIRSYMNIGMRTPEKDRKKEIEKIDFSKLKDRDKIIELINEMKLIIDMAIDNFPYNADWYAYSIYRKLYKVCIEGLYNDLCRKECLKNMRQDIIKIELLNGESKLCKVSKLEVNDIQNIDLRMSSFI